MLRAHLASVLGLSLIAAGVGCGDDMELPIDPIASEVPESTTGSEEPTVDGTTTTTDTVVTVVDPTTGGEVTLPVTITEVITPSETTFGMTTVVPTESAVPTETGGTDTGGTDESDDTAATECDTDDDCSGSMAACDTDANKCVECTDDNDDACEGDTPYCDTSDNTCGGCDSNSDCDVACNLITGECIDDDDVYYLEMESKDSCTDGEVSRDGSTGEAYCSVSNAFFNISEDDATIVVIKGGDLDFVEEITDQEINLINISKKRPTIKAANTDAHNTVNVGEDGVLYIAGIDIDNNGTDTDDHGFFCNEGELNIADVEIEGVAGGNGIDAEDCDVALKGNSYKKPLEINGVALHGIKVVDGELNVTRVKIEGAGGAGIDADGAVVTIRDSILFENGMGGLKAHGDAELSITNTAIAANGSTTDLDDSFTDTLIFGGVLLSEVTIEEFAYNTVVDNDANSNSVGEILGGSSDSVKAGDTMSCDEIDGPIRNSILVGGSDESITVNCVEDGSMSNNAIDTAESFESESAWEADGNTDVGKYDDKWFTDDESGDFHLDSAGESELGFLNAPPESDDPEEDVDGDMREAEGAFVGIDQPDAE